jgi:putative ABC transport system permease protein
MNGLWQDIQYSCRRILRRPIPNSLIVLSLALGIGANTAIFSLVHGILLKPLPFSDPERIVSVVELYPSVGESTTSPPNFFDLRNQVRTFAPLAAFTDASVVLTVPGAPPERLTGAVATADFFPLLKAPFLAGRGFLAEEDRPGAQDVVVIGSDLWRRRFGSNPAIVGQALLFDEKPYTVVGVVDSGFAFPERSQFWMPLALKNNEKMRGARWLSMIARLRPGASLDQARVEADTVAQRLAVQYPTKNQGMKLSLRPLQEFLVRNVRSSLILLMAIVAAVLLITCANVASILLGRFVGQGMELAIRSAIGSSRTLLLRPFLVETLLLSLCGGAVGLLLAAWLTSFLLAESPNATPRRAEVGIDLTALLFTLAVSLLVGLLVGMVPLLRRSVVRPASLLNGADRSPGGKSVSILRINQGIAVFEVALAVMLSVGAGLLVRSFVKLTAVSPGFRTDNSLAVDLSLPDSRYGEESRQRSFYSTLLPQVQALPGVRHAGAIFPLPMSGIAYALSFTAEDRPPADPAHAPTASVRFISPDLLDAMGIPLLRGRGFTTADDGGAQPVALVNRTLAQRIWPSQDPLGRRIAIGTRGGWITVVGVTGDLHGDSLLSEPDAEIYRPLLQVPQSQATLVVQAREAAPFPAETLRARVAQVDPALLLEDFRTLGQIISRSTSRARFQALLMGLFAVLGLCLAAVGVFGVLSHAVAQRTHEIGVRMALGATPSNIRYLVLRQAALMIFGGLVAGSLLAFMTSRALTSFLFGVERLDPVTLAFVALLNTGIGLLAIALPLRRASAVDPMVALHYE